MQNVLVNNFESILKQTEKIDLHIKALAHLSYELIQDQRTRLVFGDEHAMDSVALIEYNESNMKYRQKTKRNIDSLLYLIESNLFVDRYESNKIKEDNYNYLLAYAD